MFFFFFFKLISALVILIISWEYFQTFKANGIFPLKPYRYKWAFTTDYDQMFKQ